jgi:tripartite-type tricarboxylate transporter receptor subunit TctC
MKRTLGVMALALVLGAPVEQAADVPRPPIHIIVPFAPGTSGDLVSRLVAEELRATLGQPVLIEHQIGAAGRVGVGSLARAPADGSVIGMGNESTHVTLPLLTVRTAYDPVRDFTPLTLAARTTMAVAVNPALLPVETLAQLLALAKTRPIAFGSPGEGSPQQLIGMLLAQRSGGSFEHVPQPGAAATARELAEGRLPMAITTLSALMAYPGKVRILAIGDATRRPALPDVPTLSETWPGVVVTGWLAYFAPAGMPQPAHARLTTAVRAALARPRVIAALREQGLDPVGGSAEELGELVRAGLEAWKPQIRRASAAQPSTVSR